MQVWLVRHRQPRTFCCLIAHPGQGSVDRLTRSLKREFSIRTTRQSQSIQIKDLSSEKKYVQHVRTSRAIHFFVFQLTPVFFGGTRKHPPCRIRPQGISVLERIHSNNARHAYDSNAQLSWPIFLVVLVAIRATGTQRVVKCNRKNVRHHVISSFFGRQATLPAVDIMLGVRGIGSTPTADRTYIYFFRTKTPDNWQLAFGFCQA